MAGEPWLFSDAEKLGLDFYQRTMPLPGGVGRLTEIWMHKHPVCEYIYRVGFCIVHQRVPTDTLVRACDVVLGTHGSVLPQQAS